MKFDISIISFRTELEMLDLCLSSIDKKFDFGMINKILVVWNHDDRDCENEIEKLQKRFSTYQKVAKKLEILPRSAVLGKVTLEKLPAWRLQQVLKLQSSRHLDMDHFLMLDTKNHYLKPVALDDFFDVHGAPYVHFRGYGKGPFAEFLRNGFDYFNIPWEQEYRLQALPTTTPYMMHRTEVCAMLDHIEIKEKLNFSQAFLTKPSLMKTTEFLLYYAWLVDNHTNLDDLYRNTEDTNVTFLQMILIQKKKAK